MYSVDTNIFIDWWERRYPPDVFPSVQKAMEQLAQSSKMVAPERVLEEIDKYTSVSLKGWAKKNKSLFLPHDEDLQTEAQKILYAYPELIDTTTPYDEADRWVIALAKIKGYTVVTHETSFKAKSLSMKKPDRKMYIPDVCKALGVRCVEFLVLMRAEGWKF
jgi:hypothetical protein